MLRKLKRIKTEDTSSVLICEIEFKKGKLVTKRIDNKYDLFVFFVKTLFKL